MRFFLKSSALVLLVAISIPVPMVPGRAASLRQHVWAKWLEFLNLSINVNAITHDSDVKDI